MVQIRNYSITARTEAQVPVSEDLMKIHVTWRRTAGQDRHRVDVDRKSVEIRRKVQCKRSAARGMQNVAAADQRLLRREKEYTLHEKGMYNVPEERAYAYSGATAPASTML